MQNVRTTLENCLAVSYRTKYAQFTIWPRNLIPRYSPKRNKNMTTQRLVRRYCISLLRLTKYHRLDGFNNGNLFLTVLEAAKSKIKVLAKSISFWILFSWLVGSLHLAVCSHDFFLVLAQGKRERWSSSASSFKNTTCMTSFNLYHFPTGPISKQLPWRLELQHMNAVGGGWHRCSVNNT